MKEKLILARNASVHFLYIKIFKKVFFRMDPEKIHDRMTAVGSFLGRCRVTRKMTWLFFGYRNPILSQNIKGIRFENPIGLAAGFDKNAQMTNIIGEVGFGFSEVGSVTGEKCSGNEKPRLWRLPKSKALVVNYGLKNDGCEAIAKRLKSLGKSNIPIGISVAKTNSPDTVEKEKGIADYVKAFDAFRDIGDYITINISCPNAFGGCPFTNGAYLEDLLKEIDGRDSAKPIFIKFPANLPEKEMDEIIEVAKRHKISGFVCTNLNKDRKNKFIVEEKIPEKGGISGKVLAEESNRVISHIYQKTKGEFVIIGCGGIFSAQDAYEKIKSGASLLQLITGMIYEGPQLVSSINSGLAKLLKKDGYKNISEAVGTKIKQNPNHGKQD